MPISHVTEKDVPWTTAAHYPEALQQVVRWNTLIGAGAASWPGVPQKDVRMGVLELDAGGYYPGHAHPAPEIYFVLSGTAQWTVANETFEARPGMAIYHAPDVQHRMVNTGADVLRAVWFWWAPEGRSGVLKGEIDLLEPMPRIPKDRKPVAIEKRGNVKAGVETQLFSGAAQSSADEAQARSLARLRQSVIEKERLIRHQRIAFDLVTASAAERKKMIARAREVVERWRREQLCSLDYIERWSAILQLPVKQMAVQMTSDDNAWGPALRQNSPWVGLHA